MWEINNKLHSHNIYIEMGRAQYWFINFKLPIVSMFTISEIIYTCWSMQKRKNKSEKIIQIKKCCAFSDNITKNKRSKVNESIKSGVIISALCLASRMMTSKVRFNSRVHTEENISLNSTSQQNTTT